MTEQTSGFYCEYGYHSKLFAIACACHVKAQGLNSAVRKAKADEDALRKLRAEESAERSEAIRRGDFEETRENQVGIDPPGPEDHEDMTARGQQERLAAVAVVFAAMTLEAFINYYALTRLGITVAETLDRRVSSKDKWLLFPELATKKEYGKGAPPHQELVKLFKLRDALVHCKPVASFVEWSLLDGTTLADKTLTGSETLFSEAATCDPIRVVRQAVARLHEIDSSVDIEWSKKQVTSWEHFL
jgi:hypothetical protein